MSNKTFLRVIFICFMVVIVSIGACVASYYVFDVGNKVENIASEPFPHASISEYNDVRMTLEILDDGTITEEDVLTGIRYICSEIKRKNVSVQSKLIFFNVYTYDKSTKVYVYNGKIDTKTLYKTDWDNITKYDEMRTLIKR